MLDNISQSVKCRQSTTVHSDLVNIPHHRPTFESRTRGRLGPFRFLIDKKNNLQYSIYIFTRVCALFSPYTYRINKIQ